MSWRDLLWLVVDGTLVPIPFVRKVEKLVSMRFWVSSAAEMGRGCFNPFV